MCAISKHDHPRVLSPQRRQMLGLPDGDTDPMLDDISDTEVDLDEEPAELIEARKKLAAYTYMQGEEEPAGKHGPTNKYTALIMFHLASHTVSQPKAPTIDIVYSSQ